MSRTRAIVGAAALAAASGPVFGQARLEAGLPVARCGSDRAPVIVREWAPPFDDDLFDPDAVPTVRFGALNLKPITAEDAVNDTTLGAPVRIGVDRDLPGGAVSAATDGQWLQAGDKPGVWNLRIEAPGALMLRVHLSQLDLPEGGVLLVRGEQLNLVDMYDKAGEFWTAPTEGSFVEFQYQAPRVGAPAPTIVIDKVSHIYRTKPLAQLADDAVDNRVDLPCHEDVMCYSVDTNARDAVGLMIFTDGGTYLCTGAVLNDNDPNTYAAYFLTANHCIHTQSVVNTLTVYWLYQNLTCNGITPPLGARPRSTGGTLLWTSSTNDSTFIRLAEDVEDGQGMAAWSTAALPSSNGDVYGIHHPAGEYKRYSYGKTTGAAPTCVSRTYFWYLDWFTGTTEGGSSGSPLFNPNWEVVGQLLGSCGAANCTNQNTTNIIYGRFDRTYPNVSSWLNYVAPDDAYEDNDSFATAAPLDAGTHSLDLVDFNDYFTFTLDCDREVTIEATFSTADMNLDLQLLDSGQTVLASSTGSTGTETIIQTLAAGTYTINAIKASGWGGPYTLMLDVGDPCYDDCNQNGIDDLIDIAMGTEQDCNANMIPDICDVAPLPFDETSPVQTPFGFSANLSYTFAGVPTADSDVTVTVEGSGDFDAADESAFLLMNGVFQTTMLVTGTNCAAGTDTDVYVIPMADWNTSAAGNGGDVTLDLIPSSTMDSTDCSNNTWAQLNATYTLAPFSQDVNMDGIPDECGPTACSPADVTTQGAGIGDPGYGVPDGAVTAADLNYFVNAYVAGDIGIADVTTQGAGAGDPGYGVPDGQVTAADLQYYVNLWVVGCP